MYLEDERRIWYSKKIFDNEKDPEHKNLIAKVYYESDTKVSNEENISICNQIDDYFEYEYNHDKDNIVDIVKNIRKITSHLEEFILQIYRYGKCYYEYVSYQNGDILVSEVNKENGYDQIYVCNGDKLSINYDKEDMFLNTEEDIELINKELMEYYKIIIELNNMVKDNNLIKEENAKKLKLTL